MAKDGIQNLVDFMVEDIVAMSDEEILAEVSPEDIQRVRACFDRALEQAIFGLEPKPRQTALRVVGNGFETVELDDDGKIIEPVRCTCGSYIVFHRPNCPFFCIVS